MNAIYRYPGITPFSDKEKSVFFGREADVEKLYNSILLNQCTVITGKSGIGKTSLIHAGLKPQLEKKINGAKEDDRYFSILPIRVGIWTKTDEVKLTDKLKQVLFPQPTTSKEFLSALPEHLKNSLWFKLREFKYYHPQEKNHIFLLVFDQLEELFTYPFEQFKQLLKEFKEIMTNNLPDDVRETIEDLPQNHDQAFSKNELAAIYNSMPVKLLLSIRSDKLSLLNRLREAIPNIYQNPVELRPLSREQAARAIKVPASKTADPVIDNYTFKTDPFEIEEEAIQKICDFLENQPNMDLDSNFEDWRIEPFILQLVCQHIERMIVPNDQDKRITTSELGDLNEVIKNYYENVLKSMQLTDEDYHNVRNFIEEKMIYEPDQRRLILYKEIIIRELNITEKLLNQLVDAKLLLEISAANSKSSYEISHDWMVLPILNAKKNRLGQDNAKKFGGTILSLEEEIKKSPRDYSLYKRVGDYYYFIQDYNTALVKYSQAIRLKEQLGIAGGNLELYFNRADCFLKLQDYKASISDLKVVLAIEPRHLQANYYLAYNHHMSADYETAKEYYLKVVEIDSSYSNAYYNLGLICKHLNEYEESVNYFLKTIDLNQNDYEAYYGLGVLYATKLNKPADAIPYFNQSIELKKDYEDAYTQLAFLYNHLSENEKAIEVLQNLLKADPRNKNAWKGLGYIYTVTEQFSEAIRSFTKCISIDPKDPDPFYQLCALSNDLRKYNNAISYANSCLLIDPTHINACLEKGYAHRMLQQIEEAKVCYKKVLEIDRKNETAVRNLEAIDKYEGNEKELLAAIDQNPNDTAALLDLGTLANNKGKFKEAEHYFTQILKLKPEHKEALLELAYSYYQLKEIDKAIKTYEQLIKFDPQNPAAYSSLGKLYDSLFELEKAKQYLEIAAELDPYDHGSLYRLGLISNDEKNHEKAIEYFDKVLQLQPDYTNALVEKGFALYTLERFTEALECYKTILQYDAANSSAYYMMGLTYNQLKDTNEAYSHLLKASELNPSLADTYYALGYIADQSKDYANAISYFEHCITLNPDWTDPYIYLSKYSLQATDYENAAKYYKKLIQLEPQNADWYLNLGNALKQMNNNEEALIYYKNALELSKEDADNINKNITEIYEQLNADSNHVYSNAHEPAYPTE